MAKAIVSKVKIGLIEVDGLMLPDGSFAIGFNQACDLFDVPQKNASRTFKALLGSDLTVLKAELADTRTRTSVLSLPQFELLTAKLDRAGNQAAQDFRDDLVGLSLHQLFCDAFDIQFDADDRQELLRLRQESKQLFWILTKQVQEWINGRVCSAPINTYYSNAFDALNLCLFGKKAKAIREELGVKSLVRDHYGATALRRITAVQEQAAFVLQKDPSIKPTEAIRRVVDASAFPVCDYRE